MSGHAGDRLAPMFTACRAEDRAALIGYLPTGYPDVPGSIAALTTLVESGCDLIEVGVPYSDPGMDGPTIARATETALQGGVRVRGHADLPDSTRLEISIYRRGSRDLLARCQVDVFDRAFDGPPVTGPAGALPIGDYTIEVLAHFSDTMQPASVLAATEGGRRLRGPGMTRGRFGIPAFQIVEDHRL